MSIRRRKRIGKSLLIAGTGITMGVGCFLDNPFKKEEMISGNLMPPPMVNVCIEVEPNTARVLVDGAETADGTCTEVYEGDRVKIEATAEGYQKYEKEINADKSDGYNIQMIKSSEQTKENIEKHGTITPEGKK